MINVLGPDHLDQLIPAQVSLASSYNLRNSEDYLTVCTNTQLYLILPSVVREWDSFPDSNKNAATLESLIRRLITGVEFIPRPLLYTIFIPVCYEMFVILYMLYK